MTDRAWLDKWIDQCRARRIVRRPGRPRYDEGDTFPEFAESPSASYLLAPQVRRRRRE